MTDSIDKLSEFQELFCLEFTKDLNATQAYMRARGNKKLKYRSAQVEGSKLLSKPIIVGKIQTLMQERKERVMVDSDQILRELGRIGYSDLRELYNENGTVKHPKEWPDELARAVASIEVEETFEHQDGEKIWTGYTKKVKLWPKNNALELMGKHKKLFTEKHEHSGTVRLEDVVAGQGNDGGAE